MPMRHFKIMVIRLCQVKKTFARIAKGCPENITLVVNCFKLLFPKVLRKFFKKYHSDSSDGSDSSEKNHATSQQKDHATLFF